MAQGGSYLANAKAYNSLYTNPAGFSAGKPSLTILAMNPWAYFFPDSETIDGVSMIAEGSASGIEALNALLTESGTGLGAQIGLGYVGNGFGIGFIAMNDTFAYGPNTLGVRVDTAITATMIAGISVPINLGPFTLTPGAALRPMYRIRAYDIGISNLLGLIAGDEGATISASVLSGMAMGIDLGLNLDYGPLTASLVLRDLGGTKFNFGVLSFDDALAALGSGALPEGEPIPETEAKFIIPMSVHLGAMFHPDLGGFSFFIDPYVHAEYAATVGTGEEQSFWKNLHLGTEVRVLRMFRLRAGLNQGYTTLGIGVKLLFLEAHVAYFAREMGTYAGARQNQGVTAEVALRF
jgi:hypothetical protein